jgi:septum formation protein
MFEERTVSVTTLAIAFGTKEEPRKGEVVEVVSSDVTFVSVTQELLEWYIGTGESAGKAGSYAIQGHGSALVASSAGSMTNIIGLPLEETARLLGIPDPK